jgi:putative ABC transport system substrate-binding protein
VAVLTDPNVPGDRRVPSAFEAEARTLGVRLQRVDAGDLGAFDHAFATIVTNGADALMIMDSSLFSQHRHQLLEFARTQRLPTVCGGRQYTAAGCLVSYSANHVELFRRVAIFVDKILKGAKPAELPVGLPQKLKLFLSLKTAQALGLTIPSVLLFQADEVLR